MELTPEPQGLESRYGCVVQMRGSATPGRLQGKSEKNVNREIKRDLGEMGWHMSLRDTDGYHMCGAPVH